ncbi:hypothetical protein [Spongiactinospora sp. TRM90649]|uniref:hypothetical protein n=1 Tax=Spongiactinospora sp. TRM90649 TaxID=3031114 RepID=UPI0023F71D7B|nr:hypothetical protein [Spongiactinospora sp. TRM90649]MDF5756653.1 hypothetical protein [Spongiactinospora sp. TRM90649]
MAYKPRVTEKTITLKGAAIASSVHVLWRASVPCRVTAVRAYRLGGSGAVINAAKNGTDLCSADLSVSSAATWMSGTLAAPAALRLAEGDTLTAEVVSAAGSPTDLAIQIDIRKDASY